MSVTARARRPCRKPLPEQFPALSQIWVDMGDQGRVRDGEAETLGVTLTVVTRLRRWTQALAPPPWPPMTVLPRRRVVERTVAGLGRNRRLSKDYEPLPATEAAQIDAAMTHLTVRRLAL